MASSMHVTIGKMPEVEPCMALSKWWHGFRHGAAHKHKTRNVLEQSSGRGFSDAPSQSPLVQADAEFPRAPRTPLLEETDSELAGAPFPSTGPHGHRGRMREKLLTRGADS